MHMIVDDPQGSLRYVGVHTCEQWFWNIPQDTFYSWWKNHPLNKDLVGFCSIWPLDRFAYWRTSVNFEQKPCTPFFPEKWHFRTLNAFPALCVLLQKRLLHMQFFIHACVHQYVWVAFWGVIIPKTWQLVIQYKLSITVCFAASCFQTWSTPSLLSTSSTHVWKTLSGWC